MNGEKRYSIPKIGHKYPLQDLKKETPSTLMVNLTLLATSSVQWRSVIFFTFLSFPEKCIPHRIFWLMKIFLKLPVKLWRFWVIVGARFLTILLSVVVTVHYYTAS